MSMRAVEDGRDGFSGGGRDGPLCPSNRISMVQHDLNHLVSILHDLHGLVYIQWEFVVLCPSNMVGLVLCPPSTVLVAVCPCSGIPVHAVSPTHGPLSLEDGTGAPWLSRARVGAGSCRSSLPSPSAPPPTSEKPSWLFLPLSALAGKA